MLTAKSPVFSGFFSTFKPDPILTVSEWSDLYRKLPQISAAEPGQWRTERTPYLKAIMDDLSPTSPVEEVVFMKGAQIGASESGNNWVGYVMDKAPGPMLVVQPTVDIAKRYSQQRISPMITECDSLRQKVNENRSRDSTNTQMSKEFPGGVLLLAGANSAAGLRSMPIKFLMLDEVDAYPPDCDGEGSPIDLAVARTRTFNRRKIYKVSTPTIKGVSHIDAEYQKTDQRKYHVPCPHCGVIDYLRWGNFVIPTDESGVSQPEDAHFVCAHCNGKIEEKYKTDMLAKGRWVPTSPEKEQIKRRGYHLSSLYSPVGWYSWAEAAKQWLESQGNTMKMKTFINTVLGEVWEELGESVSDQAIYNRVQASDYDYDGRVMLPDGVLLVVNGVDVQPDRLELETVGWGIGQESWSIDYRVFMGDPNGELVWQLLDAYLATEFQHPTGVRLRAARTFLDTRGQNTASAYSYVADRASMGVFGIMGLGGDGFPAVGNPKKTNLSKVPIVPLGTFVLKDSVFGSMSLERPGPGYCHWPKRYTPSYFKGLTSEEVRVKLDGKGFPVREWFKKSSDARNEPLDCRVYATGAMLSLNVNFEHLAEMIHGTQAQNGGRSVRGEMVPAA